MSLTPEQIVAFHRISEQVKTPLRTVHVNRLLSDMARYCPGSTIHTVYVVPRYDIGPLPGEDYFQQDGELFGRIVNGLVDARMRVSILRVKRVRLRTTDVLVVRNEKWQRVGIWHDGDAPDREFRKFGLKRGGVFEPSLALLESAAKEPA